MADPAESPSASPDDAFGRPHAQQVSDSLQMWILIPGIFLLMIAGYFIYRLLSSQSEKVKKQEEKKRQKQERREKKKTR